MLNDGQCGSFYRLGNDIEKVVEVAGSRQSAEGAVRVVAGQSVIATALNVERDQIHAEGLVRLLEQMVGELLRNVVVKVLHGLRGQSDEELVQVARSVDDLRAEEVVTQQHLVFHLALRVH